jgi:two-component system sensor histidine kinase KdpD
VRAPDALPARLDADAFARILQNLPDNAEKYTREAADRRVEVRARAGAGAVEIAVVDHGQGVPRRAARRLFRPFHRGARRGDGPAGLGLGLALASTLARSMGGELAHRPTPGGGATFVLTLPTAA